MPVYETSSEGGRISIRLKSHQLAEQDIQTYGAIKRSDAELGERARYHVTQMQGLLPTTRAVLADDLAALTNLVEQHYPTIYKGLLVAYTGLQELFRLTLEPRCTTTVNLDDTEDEHPFTGLTGLQAIIKEEQARRRKTAQADEESSSAYLLTMVQVTIYDAREAALEWYERQSSYLCYNLKGNRITGAYARLNVSDEVLRGLGLPGLEQPNAKTIVSANKKRGEGHETNRSGA